MELLEKLTIAKKFNTTKFSRFNRNNEFIDTFFIIENYLYTFSQNLTIRQKVDSFGVDVCFSSIALHSLKSYGNIQSHELNNIQGSSEAYQRKSEIEKLSKNKKLISLLSYLDIQFIKKASKYASKYDLRPALTNVCLNGSVCATDGHQLIKEKYYGLTQWNKTNDHLLIPFEVAKHFDVFKNDIEIYVNEGTNKDVIFISDGNVEIIYEHCDSRYPDIDSVISISNRQDIIFKYKESTKNFSHEKENFYYAIKRMSLYANKITGRISFNFTSNNMLEIEADNSDYGLWASEIHSYDGESINNKSFDIDAKKLLKIIEPYKKQDITLSFVFDKMQMYVNDKHLVMGMKKVNN